ncbi:PHP domain-containing protein [Natronolimnohabitans innermongolicus]|uniref:histidinol-phosphatase n=1 Tax=Natronolimnohabitans innermongolicus JCM 12255 TaxID=1227499 RepID=L9WUM0_9EURY|nr:PHP domain-containing protein [Natronolimnohabitans innermongolicus]ELY53184.1 HisJ family histidinol phosphate phosphatase [Natronolimnohabitans innermongolicus JCM 12255]
MEDFHAHTNYSDGGFLKGMVDAADAAGLEGIGLTDHCAVSSRERPTTMRSVYGFNLDLTYERRRRAIEAQREREDVSLSIYDGVEMDYDPRDEREIEDFLETADFDYSIGSVHAVDGLNVQARSNFTGLSDAELEAVVDGYFENLVSLVGSELFDVAAHLDLIERTPQLRGRATTDQYERVARALADSRTVPEVNAGRATVDMAIVHPSETFLEVLREYDVSVTVGSDSHRPGEIGERADFLADYLDERGLETVRPPGLT